MLTEIMKPRVSALDSHLSLSVIESNANMSDHSEHKWIVSDLNEGHKCASCLAASLHLREDLLFAFNLINHTDVSETEMISAVILCPFSSLFMR